MAADAASPVAEKLLREELSAIAAVAVFTGVSLRRSGVPCRSRSGVDPPWGDDAPDLEAGAASSCDGSAVPASCCEGALSPDVEAGPEARGMSGDETGDGTRSPLAAWLAAAGSGARLIVTDAS
ncbi:hypothetical protein [Jiella pelagia]|uniref:Uncharacterized protein n=1 Tax=Jiella pelagia TaxID=2986949 RepID=A0ABY7BVV0_9HYPH|nr:hypothetical protein [Jiella pelagia]WAP67512.1 hypothetical protein OH818_18615 [Jiella pelagia]